MAVAAILSLSKGHSKDARRPRLPASISSRAEGNYAGTVISALIDQILRGADSNDDTVIFHNTGGLSAIFTFAEELAAHVAAG